MFSYASSVDDDADESLAPRGPGCRRSRASNSYERDYKDHHHHRLSSHTLTGRARMRITMRLPSSTGSSSPHPLSSTAAWRRVAAR